MTSNKQKRHKAPTPELPDELIFKILIRLPVNISFHRWQHGASEDPLVHVWDFLGEFRSVSCFCHCDGLVLVPTATMVYLLNPAIRDVITLPESGCNKVSGLFHRPIGFGRDPRTGMYKIVRYFCRPRDCKTGIFGMGMEVCTVGGPPPLRWREIAADLLYDPLSLVTTQSVKGGVYWIIDDARRESCPRSLLCFGLDNEVFSAICLPSDLSDTEDDDNSDDDVDEHFNLSVLHGELCLTGYHVKEPNDVHRLAVVWALVEEDGARSMWEPRYTYVMGLLHPVVFLPGMLILWFHCTLYRYGLQSHVLSVMCDLGKLRYRHRGSDKLESAWKNVNYFNVIPYTESLVPVAACPASAWGITFT
ncbi:hypothetical protein VPH35_049189 [Triticum aestivum]